TRSLATHSSVKMRASFSIAAYSLITDPPSAFSSYSPRFFPARFSLYSSYANYYTVPARRLSNGFYEHAVKSLPLAGLQRGQQRRDQLLFAADDPRQHGHAVPGFGVERVAHDVL